jgi:hypothetical protein
MLRVIIRQMMKHIEIVDPGDTTFLEGEFVSRWDLKTSQRLDLRQESGNRSR